jgi:hypothetical protein
MEGEPVVTGVLIFLLGQFVLRMILEPVVAARKTLAVARTTFEYYADLWANPPPGREATSEQELEARREASSSLRRTAGELRVVPSTVLGYKIIRRLFDLPSPQTLDVAAKGFLGLSNSVFGGSDHSLAHVIRNSDDIKKSLGLALGRAGRGTSM